MSSSSIIAAVVTSVAAALCYALGAALEQRAAARTDGDSLVHPGLLWQVLRRPVWLAGLAVMTVGEVLHVVALSWAPLAVVQPVGVTTVLFALPLGAVLAHRYPRPRELAAAGLIVVGLVVLLGGMHVTEAVPVLPDARLVVLAPVALGVIAAVTVIATRLRGPARTVLLGCAAGTAFGVTASVMRVITHRVAAYGAAGLVGWASVALVVTAVAGLLLEQGAYKSGQLGTAVAGYTVTDPLVAVTVGALVLHEPVSFGHPVLAAVAAVVVGVAVVVLARTTATATERRRSAIAPLERPSRPVVATLAPAAGTKTGQESGRHRARAA